MKFIYLFPIFCFGLVITGIVLLGLMEAGRVFKSHGAAPAREGEGAATSRTPPQ